MITVELLQKVIPSNTEQIEWCELLNSELPKYEINTKERICAFLAQCAHESGDFRTLKENLNYSKDGLLKIFPKYFTEKTAEECHRQPMKIANIVYANRMGNGDTASGDGYKFSGKGLIQLTGKSNYTQFSMDTFGDTRLVDTPDYVSTKEGALRSACWFWKKNGLNTIADSGDFVKLTKKINGGTIGIEHRMEKYQIALANY
jgi:putative chitinase